MLTDGNNEKLDLTDQEQGNDVSPATPADPWAEAFAALEADAPEPNGGDTPVVGESGNGEGQPAGSPEGANVQPEPGNAPVDLGDVGGSLPTDSEPGAAGGDFDESAIQETLTNYTKDIESRAISETAQMFLDRVDDQGNKMIRQSDGKLGATINDPDIYRVDQQTGTASFYNPDTGRPFTGDNPRAQAKAWVDAYNEELRETFNKFAEEHQSNLEKEAAPVIELLKFMPTYKKLDPVRQQMLDALIDDYEVHNDKGEAIGYSIDLNKALAQVNKQVEAIKNSRPKAPPTGPAVDMPASGSGDSGSNTDFKSIAEAMEALQDAQLSKLNKR